MYRPVKMWPGLALLLTLTLLACGGDQGDMAQQLLGEWELEYATRNGRPTTSLEALYFSFAEEGRLRTNLAGMDEEATYSLAKNRIAQRESQYEVDYTVDVLTDSILVLSANINGFDFRFHLRRAGGEDPGTDGEE